MPNGIVYALLLAAVLYISFSATLFFTQSRIVYYPERHIITTPAAIQIPYQDVVFSAEDGTKLTGWFIPASTSKGVILFCHGNAGNISHRLDTIDLFHRLGYSTFIFDYRGYGQSEGSPSEKGTYQDVDAAWKHLTRTKGISPSDIIIFGRSLGSSIGAWLAGREQPAACILESSFTSARDVAATLYPYLPVSILCRYKYDSAEALKTVQCPLLFIHSTDDEIIPIQLGRKLYAAAPEPKTFVQINGDHNSGFILSAKKYENGIHTFLDGLKPSSPSAGQK
jgi:uncharacterized protein